MSLSILWFILIAVLFCVYFILDGMDFGIGMMFPFFGSSEKEKNKILDAIGPTWGASEVWLLTAGGAMFAAFPGWYATMFSGFYPALFLLLFALIARGTGIEFWHKSEHETGKKFSTVLAFLGSLLTPLLLGVALANLLQGVPIDEEMNFTGNLLSLFSPFTLCVGLGTVAFFLYHGAVFLKLKTDGAIEGNDRLIKLAGSAAIVMMILIIVTLLISRTIEHPVFSSVCLAAAAVSLLLSFSIARKKANLVSLVLNCLVIAASIAALFSSMFPNVMVSTTDAAFNLTISNVSSSPYTLRIMTIVTCMALPVVILYTAWSHWLFRKLCMEKDDLNNGQKSGY